jgi:hypothetical protein
LSARSNKARPLERIPDIYGSVKAIPDVIAPTYSTYENNKEIEHGFYCVGRGEYLIEEVRDSDTPIDLINGASAGVYNPFNSPNAGPPDIAIGGHISEGVVAAYRSNQVDGITVSPDFASGVFDSDQIIMAAVFGEPNHTAIIRIDTQPWDSSYIVGENAVLTNVVVGIDDYSGTHEIIAVNENGYSLELDLGFPFGAGGIPAAGGSIEPENVKEFTDWFYMTEDLFNRAIINIVAPNGMFLDDGSLSLQLRSVNYEFQIEGVDNSGAPDGNVFIIPETITGSQQSIVALTTFHDFVTPTRFRVRAKRLTSRYIGPAQVVDEIKLDDVYGVTDINVNDFGNITTIQTRTIATPFATASRQRELSCIATELINEYQGGGFFDPSLTPNKRGIQSFIKAALDESIGNRTEDEVALDELLALDAEINSYFGNAKMGEFSYTFDSTDISFQEVTQTIFDAVFCIAFRENGKIDALLEKIQNIPSMLFTHRSKQPNSESQSRNFNPSTINDGVEFTYVDPDTDTDEVIYIPENKTAVNPKEFNIAGIRNRQQALVRARREYNKILHQKVSLEVTVTAEGRYIKPLDMIAVVKGTRVKTFDGEIIAQDGLTLTLSADVEFGVGDHTIVLKDEEGGTESILVTAGTQPNQVILNLPPAQTIRTGIDKRRTEFSFGPEATHLAERFLTQEIDISDKWFVNLKAINYSDEYYSQDSVSVRAFSNGFNQGFS